VFRETLEAAIIVAVLLGLVEQLVNATDSTSATPTTLVSPSNAENAEKPPAEADQAKTPETPSREADMPVLDNAAEPEVERATTNRALIRKMRFQVRDPLDMVCALV
jgi:high-affinity iron transporter